MTKFVTKPLTTIALTMNNIQYSFPTNTSKILDIRGPILSSEPHPPCLPLPNLFTLTTGKKCPLPSLSAGYPAHFAAPCQVSQAPVCVDPCRPLNRRAARTITVWEHLPTGMFGGSEASP